MSTFVFFHVGDDIAMPQAMVASLRAHNPGAEIIQVTDDTTPVLDGVTWSVVTEGDRAHLMEWRTRGFAELGLPDTAMYLDTDMIVHKPIHPDDLLGDAHIAVCRRHFGRAGIFNPSQRGQDYSEYAGKTMDEVYPYLGCCTITASSAAWEELTDLYAELPPKYHVWYGDQEVLREYVQSLPATWVEYLPESHYACLPEYLPQFPHPAIVHYKGKRKALLTANALAV